MSLTGGEFHSTVDYLGFTDEDLSVLLSHEGNPIAQRTVRAWRRGRDPIPDDVARRLSYLVSVTDRAVEDLADQVVDTAWVYEPNDVALTVYPTDEEFAAAHPAHAARGFTARWWRHVAMRARTEVEGDGWRVIIAHTDEDEEVSS